MSDTLSRYVIAEIGINHDGDENVAKALIHDASRAGCFGVKFQYRNIDRTYGAAANEIGDEILQEHISKSYLSPKTILSLRNYASDLGLKVGISFFTTEDVKDFETDIEVFDFFKVPSVELLNDDLINNLLHFNRMVYLSTGMHKEDEIDYALDRIANYSNWMPLHCISNYPLANHNIQLGQLKYLQRWNRGVGYSSHDMNWENCIAALTLGSTLIERHITHSKTAEGLDHSSSSDFQEFVRICDYAREIDLMLLGNGPRVPNQGELLNRQNLGRSFYAQENLEAGQKISVEHLAYRSPRIGLDYRELMGLRGEKLVKSILKGQALTESHFIPTNLTLDTQEISIAADLGISIPVRLKDYDTIRQILPTRHYEFHLSYGEIEKIENTSIEVGTDSRFSVHLPDYISHNDLINPWAKDVSVREKSHSVIRKTLEFSEGLAKKTGKKVPIVASLAGFNLSKEEFFTSVSKLFSDYKNNHAILTLQWLPPIAWYFGGSVKLPHANNLEDARYIKHTDIPLTLDSSHLILGKNFFGFDANEIFELIQENISHVHLSDAYGLDGEGMQISERSDNLKIIRKCLDFDVMKVIEVWQGHLDEFSGFKRAIKEIVKVIEIK